MHRRRFLAAFGTAATAGVAGCSARALTGGGFDVGMRSDAFFPRTYETTVGEPVVWENTGARGHTVTAYADAIPDDAAYFASGGFESERAARADFRRELTGGGLIPPGEQYVHAFEVPGRYPYFCIPHESAGMVGTVVVRER